MRSSPASCVGLRLVLCPCPLLDGRSGTPGTLPGRRAGRAPAAAQRRPPAGACLMVVDGRIRACRERRRIDPFGFGKAGASLQEIMGERDDVGLRWAGVWHVGDQQGSSAGPERARTAPRPKIICVTVSLRGTTSDTRICFIMAIIFGIENSSLSSSFHIGKTRPISPTRTRAGERRLGRAAAIGRRDGHHHMPRSRPWLASFRKEPSNEPSQAPCDGRDSSDSC